MTKRSKIKRPYMNLYFTGVHDREPSAVSHGACASEKGAIRASVVRIFMDQYAKCIVMDRELAVPVYTITRGASGIRVNYGATTGEQSHSGSNVRPFKRSA